MGKMSKKTKSYKHFFEEAKRFLSSEQLNKAEKRAKKTIQHLQLGELRRQLGTRQSDLKSFSQPSVSRLEMRKDMKLSTLIQYVHGLGMKLQIRVYSPKSANKKSHALVTTLLEV
jgi:hypothetical protein